MPFRPAQLSSFPLLHTSDPELARDRFAFLGLQNFDVGRGQKFGVHVNHLQMTDLELAYCAFASDIALGFREASFVRQIFNIDGAGRYKAGTQSGEITHGSWSPVLSTGTPLNLELKSRYRQLVLRIELDALKRNLGALIGQAQRGAAFAQIDVGVVAVEAAAHAALRDVIAEQADFRGAGVFQQDRRRA